MQNRRTRSRSFKADEESRSACKRSRSGVSFRITPRRSEALIRNLRFLIAELKFN